MDIKNILETNFDIAVKAISFIDSHFGTEIYKVDTAKAKYFVKTFPPQMEGVENESVITDFLLHHGINVPVFLKTKNNCGAFICDDFQLTVQAFIDGEKSEINTASGDNLFRQAELLGKINLVLADYRELPLNFGADFFSTESASAKCKDFKAKLQNRESLSETSKNAYSTQIRHLEKICSFDIDTGKLTYANSHGDFNICQTIKNGHDLTVVDWSSAYKMPVCLEVITSYAFASQKSAKGCIDAAELKDYISAYLKYFCLNGYDLKMMPYVFYFWHTMCNYYPGEKIADNYKPIARLINSLQDWLYENVDNLSEQLTN